MLDKFTPVMGYTNRDVSYKDHWASQVHILCYNNLLEKLYNCNANIFLPRMPQININSELSKFWNVSKAFNQTPKEHNFLK